MLNRDLIDIFLSSLILIFTSCKSDVRDTDSKSSTNVSEYVRTFTDPFAYCKAVVNIDSPDSRYVGPKVPEVIARGLQKAFEAPADKPLDVFIRGTYWHCVDGKVYACNVGAN